jgi:hypothetical protein
MSMLS